MNTNEKCIENQLSYKQKRILKPLKSLQYRTSSEAYNQTADTTLYQNTHSYSLSRLPHTNR